MSSRSLWRVCAGLAVSFAALTAVVVGEGGVPGDSELLVRFASAPALDPAAGVVHRSTGYLPVGLATGLLVLVLRAAGRGRDSVLVAVSVAGAVVGTVLLKQLVGRPRPELLPRLADVSASYPSGHLAATTALVGAVVMATRGRRGHRQVVLAASALVVVAAAAQLALARHHPSDLLGGVLWSAACTTAAWAVLGGAGPQGTRRP